MLLQRQRVLFQGRAEKKVICVPSNTDGYLVRDGAEQNQRTKHDKALPERA